MQRAWLGSTENISLYKVWYNCYTVRFDFDPEKSKRLRANPERGIGFEESQTLFEAEHIVDRRSDDPEQFRAIGWVNGTLYSVIYEVRQDAEGELCHLVTLWKATKEERRADAEYIQ